MTVYPTHATGRNPAATMLAGTSIEPAEAVAAMTNPPRPRFTFKPGWADRVPRGLKEHPRWVLWQFVRRAKADGTFKWTKVPVRRATRGSPPAPPTRRPGLRSMRPSRRSRRMPARSTASDSSWVGSTAPGISRSRASTSIAASTRTGGSRSGREAASTTCRATRRSRRPARRQDLRRGLLDRRRIVREARRPRRRRQGPDRDRQPRPLLHRHRRSRQRPVAGPRPRAHPAAGDPRLHRTREPETQGRRWARRRGVRPTPASRCRARSWPG